MGATASVSMFSLSRMAVNGTVVSESSDSLETNVSYADWMVDRETCVGWSSSGDDMSTSYS